MIYAPGSDFSSGREADTRVERFLPESDDALVDVINEMNTPVTVDEVADALIEPAYTSIETWASIHERLHQERLPALDESGAIEFDETQGLVERSVTHTGGGQRFSPAVLATISIGLLLLFIALVSVSVLIS
ncbi:hypothetical protein [Natrinema ejinorense]|uniref:Uncharacterized protein n=1 Tax=Natrinema ejinorense TaxID=373386 RepID=A0A2A5R0Q2_9EURY|nr:hypothetical protein [Natrinema ejinorense]PCR92589.1 hypothetical protein CP557_03260 [Natrinema ejinorense]